MADAVAVPVSGFVVPPAGGNVQERAPAPAPAPAPTPEAPAQGLTAEQVAAQIKAAMPQPQAQTPTYDFAEDMGTDPVLTSLHTAFSSVGKGIDLDRALGHALSLGRPDLIDVAYIKEKGGDSAEALVKIAKGIVDRVQTQSAAATTAVYSVAGSEADWNAAASAFNQSAPAHLKTVIAGLLDSGNKDAIKQAAQAVVDYSKQNGLVANPAQLVNAGATGLSSAQAMSKGEFQDALFKLDPNNRNYATDREALLQRRFLGKQLGK